MTSTARAAAAESDRVRLLLDARGGSSGVVNLGDDRWLVPFEATRIGPTLRMSGQTNESVVVLPVLDGTVPESLRARLSVSPDVDSGWIEYQAPGVPTRLLRFEDLGGRPQDADVTLDLRGMQVAAGRLTLTLRSRLRTTDPGCVTSLIGAWAELRNGGVVLTGSAVEPRSVAEYIPDLLLHIDIYVPAQPDAAEAEAVLDIAAYATRRAIGRNPEIQVLSLPDGGGVPDVASVPGTRAVAIASRFDPGAAVVRTANHGSVLAVGGPPAVMDRTVTALTSAQGGLAVGSVVNVQRFDPDGAERVVPVGVPADPGSSTTITAPGSGASKSRTTKFTLEDLQTGTARMTGLGRLQLGISVDQARLGGPVEAAHVHLEGNLTPIAKGADATLSVMVDNRMVDSRSLVGFEGDKNASGRASASRFVVDTDIPKDRMTRDLSITVVVDYTPAGGECRLGDVPFMYQLDPVMSTITIEPGASLPPSFARFPQTLLPTFTMGIDTLSIDRLMAAARLISVMQRVSAVALDPVVTGVDEALLVDGPAVIVAKGAPALLASAPLLSTGPLSAIDAKHVERLRFDVNLGHAILEAFEFHAQDRLLLTWADARAPRSTPGAEMAGQLLDGISTRTATFNSLFGDTYIVSEGAPPLSISLRFEDVQRTPLAAAPNYLARAMPLAKAALAAFAMVLVMWGAVRRRRRLQTTRHPAEASSTDSPPTPDRP